jgi:hypothetical protein
MQAPGRNWRMIAAGVALALVVLAVVGRLQSRGLGTGRTGPSVITPATGPADGTSASGLSLTGRVALPGRPAAVAVGEGAVWVLLEQRNTLLRVDPTRHQVTGTVDLAAPGGGQVFGLVTAGQDAVWVGAAG